MKNFAQFVLSMVGMLVYAAGVGTGVVGLLHWGLGMSLDGGWLWPVSAVLTLSLPAWGFSALDASAWYRATHWDKWHCRLAVAANVALALSGLGTIGYFAWEMAEPSPLKYAVVSMELRGDGSYPGLDCGPIWLVGPDGARIIPDGWRPGFAVLKDGEEVNVPHDVASWDRPRSPTWNGVYWGQFLETRYERVPANPPMKGISLSSVRVYDPR